MTSNDPENPKLFLDLSGTVVTEVQVEPRTISFGQIGKGEKSSKEFTIQVAEPDKVKITSVTVDNDAFKLERQPDAPDGSMTYTVSFAGSKKTEQLMARISVDVEGASMPKIDVPVRASVVGDLRYARSLYFTKRDAGFSTRDITLSSRSKRNIKVKKVEDPDKVLEFEIVTNNDPEVKVRAKVRDEKSTYSPPKRGTAFVYTDSQDEPKIEIGYTVAEYTGRPRPPLAAEHPPGSFSAEPPSVPAPPEDSE